ncbi:DUF6884 domain-containing protein [Streptomyces chartreusis]|uniref:DUF6884 domain-containing protein n=1 Tax=Streptomyces chartreusis TaxID=1969 RepID=UPI0037FE7C70
MLSAYNERAARHLAAQVAVPLTSSDEPAGRVIVIVPCSAAIFSVDRPTPARHLYTGSYHLMCRRAAERIVGPAGVLVLSALHGFVQLDDELLPYEQRMDAPGHVSVAQLRAQAAALGILAARDLVALGGRAYVDAVTGRTLCALWTDAEASASSALASPASPRPPIHSTLLGPSPLAQYRQCQVSRRVARRRATAACRSARDRKQWFVTSL